MKRTASIKRFPLLVCAFFLAGLAFLCPGQAAAQATQDYGLPQGFTFWNVLSSDVVEALGRNNDKEWLEYIRRQNYNAEFAGIKEKVCIQYESDKLDFLLAPEFSLSDAGQHWTPYDANWSSINHALNHDDLCFSWTGLEWYLSFMPFDLVEVNLHRNVRTEGGYLPALGRWLDEADLQGDGFAPVTGTFDAIVTNPPIRVGKAVIYGLFDRARDFLNPGGRLYVVIRKQQGAPSALKHLKERYKTAGVIDRGGGFWVIEASME